MAPMLFARAILAGEPIQVFNDGRMQRDFTYVDDIVEGVVRVLARPPARRRRARGDLQHRQPRGRSRSTTSSPRCERLLGREAIRDDAADAAGRRARDLRRDRPPARGHRIRAAHAAGRGPRALRRAGTASTTASSRPCGPPGRLCAATSRIRDLRHSSILRGAATAPEVVFAYRTRTTGRSSNEIDARGTGAGGSWTRSAPLRWDRGRRPRNRRRRRPKIGSSLIGKLEGPEIILDAKTYPKTFKEAPILAEQVKAGKLPAVDKRLPEPSQLFVVKPLQRNRQVRRQLAPRVHRTRRLRERRPDRFARQDPDLRLHGHQDHPQPRPRLEGQRRRQDDDDLPAQGRASGPTASRSPPTTSCSGTTTSTSTRTSTPTRSSSSRSTARTG